MLKQRCKVEVWWSRSQRVGEMIGVDLWEYGVYCSYP